MPNEGGGGKGGLGGGGNYQKPSHSTAPRRPGSAGGPKNPTTYNVPSPEPHTEHGANTRGPVESGGYRQSYNQGGQVKQSGSGGHTGVGPSGRQVFHTAYGWDQIRQSNQRQNAVLNTQRARALAILKTTTPHQFDAKTLGSLTSVAHGFGTPGVQTTALDHLQAQGVLPQDFNTAKTMVGHLGTKDHSDFLDSLGNGLQDVASSVAKGASDVFHAATSKQSSPLDRNNIDVPHVAGAAAKVLSQVPIPGAENVNPGKIRGAFGKAVGAAAQEISHTHSITSTPLSRGGIGDIPQKFVSGQLANVKAAVEHPGPYTTHTLSGAANTLKGIFPALVGLPVKEAIAISHGKPMGPVNELTQGIAKDYSRRYSGSISKDEKRIVKEGGFPELLDTAAVVGGAEGTVGRLPAAVERARVEMGAKPGFFTRDRPVLRRTTGDHTLATREQPLAKGVLKITGQRALDRLRTRADIKREAKSTANPTKGAPVLQAGPGEVTPLVNRGAAMRWAPAQLKGRGLLMMHNIMKRDVGGLQTTFNKGTNSSQREAALTLMARGDVPVEKLGTPAAHEDIARIQDILTQRASQIENHRATAFDTGGPFDNAAAFRKMAEPGTTEKLFTEKVREAARAYAPVDAFHAALHPHLQGGIAEARRVAPQAHILGLKQGEIPTASTGGIPAMKHTPETDTAFAQRVAAEAKAQGHLPGAYVRSSNTPWHSPAEHAIGGYRFPASPRKYEGHHFLSGREDLSSGMLTSSLRKTIKEAHSAKLVDATMHASALPGARGVPMVQALKAIRQGGYNPKDIYIWNHGAFNGELKDLTSAPSASEHTVDETAHTATQSARIQPETIKLMEQALANHEAGHISGPELEQQLEKLGGGSKESIGSVSVVPKQAGDEIVTATRPAGKLLRGWDMYKGKTSRIILGTHPGWAVNMGISYTALAGLGTKGRAFLPWTATNRIKYFKSLEPSVRDEIGSAIGLGKSASGSMTAVPHGGSTFAGKPTQLLRAAKGSRAGQIAHKANPFDALFQIEAQPRYWASRRQFVDSLAHDPAVKMTSGMKQHLSELIDSNEALSHEIHGSPSLQDRMLAVSGSETGDQQRLAHLAFMENPHAVERAAKATYDWMGDYVSSTARQRSTSHFLMFQNFLRHSLRLLFKTLPLEHPYMGMILLKLGQLHADEVKKIIGDNPGGSETSLPLALGSIRLGKNGELAIDVKGGNPFTSNVTGDEGNIFQQLFKSIPPAAQSAVMLGTGYDPFTGKQANIMGTHAGQHGAPTFAQGADAGAIVSALVKTNLANLISPERAAESVQSPNSQSQADSLYIPGIGGTREYKAKTGSQIALQVTKKGEAAAAGSPWIQLLRKVGIPVIPYKDNAKAKAQRVRDYKASQNKKGGSGGTSNPKKTYNLGGGSSGTSGVHIGGGSGSGAPAGVHIGGG